jgi:DNA-binding transcriptional LysR family regulator
MSQRAPRVTLDQWRALQAVIDHGGYAQAAAHLHRSQSSVSYTVARLQEQLGMPLLYIDGRKARLTEAGEVLLRRSRQLLQEATQLESLAHTLEQGWEPVIRLVVDAAFPAGWLMQALARFAPQAQGTQVQLREVVLSGADDALREGAELVIGVNLPDEVLGEALSNIEFIAVAHPEHPLHQLERSLTASDLRKATQVVISDSGREARDIGWLGAERRWTVTSIDTALSAVRHCLGFGWLPAHKVAAPIERGELRALPLREGQRYTAPLYLVFGQGDNVGPATRALAGTITQVVREQPTAD